MHSHGGGHARVMTTITIGHAHHGGGVLKVGGRCWDVVRGMWRGAIVWMVAGGHRGWVPPERGIHRVRWGVGAG